MGISKNVATSWTIYCQLWWILTHQFIETALLKDISITRYFSHFSTLLNMYGPLIEKYYLFFCKFP